MNGQEPYVAQPAGAAYSFLDLEPVDGTHAEVLEMEDRCGSEPNNIVLLNYLANEYFRLGYFRKAQAAAKVVVQREPSRAKAWQLLARCQLILGEKDGARESLTRCLEHPEAGSRTRKWSADRLDELVDGPTPTLATTSALTEAVRQNLEAKGVLTAITSPDRSQLESVGELYRGNPDKEGVADWYAFLLYSNNETAAAIDVYQGMLKTFGASENSLYYLGCSCLRAANVKAALQYWNKLKQMYPRSYFLPKIFDKVRRLRELHEQGLGLAARRSPRSDEHTLLQQATAFDDASAIDEAEAMVAGDANNPTVLDWAAYIHFQRGNFDRACSLYERALRLGFDKSDTFFHLGEAYRRLGRVEQASRVWTTVIKRFPLDRFAALALEELKMLAD